MSKNPRSSTGATHLNAARARLPQYALGLLLMLGLLGLGQTAALGQYPELAYPPAVLATGLDPSGTTLLTNGGGGSYSGGYYASYSYDITMEDGTTTTQSATAYFSVSLFIESGPMDGIGYQYYVEMSVYNNGSGSTDYWNGYYYPSNGSFTQFRRWHYDSGSNSWLELPPANASAVNTDGSPWTAPPLPPFYPHFGPASIWIDGTVYPFSYTAWYDGYFAGSWQRLGMDYYSGSGEVYVQDGGNVEGYTYSPEWIQWTGTYSNGVFATNSGQNVMAADSGGNLIFRTAPPDMPPALRVDGNTSLWKYVGLGSHHIYAGYQPGQWLAIDPQSGTLVVQGDGNTGFYTGGVVWMPAEGRDIRAVNLDGTPLQPYTQPSWGPMDVWVSGAVWRYAGTYQGEYLPSGTSPAVGDHYLGDNGGQRLVIDPSGNVTLTNLTYTAWGTYTSPGASLPRMFRVADDTNGLAVDVYPGDGDGPYHQTQPAAGPPAVWVNEVLFQFTGSDADASQPGSWVDIYADGAGGQVMISTGGAWGFGADLSLVWSASYVRASSNTADGGLFVVDNSNGAPRYDVRASSGIVLLPATGSPSGNHPAVVKVDGNLWRFAGTLSGANPVDYYLGASAGQQLWIDSTGAVAFWTDTTSPNLAGTGRLVGTVFIVDGHDLRACTADNLPVPPSGSPQWGPAKVTVEGVVWNYLGTVSDDTLQIHADYYGGINVGEVLAVHSNSQVTGFDDNGTYDGGVFVVPNADIRALEASGNLQAPIGIPAAGHPETLRAGGLQWQFLGSSAGVDYYATTSAGQRLSINSSGAVTYFDRPGGVANATGTYANGTFAVQSGGASYNGGTPTGDLDILGNLFSMGSLANDANTAGLTIVFQDDLNAQPGPAATVGFTASRPLTHWLWSRASTTDPNGTVPMMQVDTSHRLNLFDPTNATLPAAIVLDPGNGTSTFTGPVQFNGRVRVPEQGDIGMGEFTTQPAAP